MKRLNILFLASEAEPLIKVGGLGDVGFSLPHALRSLLPADIKDHQIDVRLVLPCYPTLQQNCDNAQLVSQFYIEHLEKSITAQVYQIEISNLPVYLINGDPIQAEPTVYSTNSKLDGNKFTFFSLAALEFVKRINWQPDIVHVNDWHTALVAYMLKKHPSDFFKNTRSVLTVHNLPYLGVGAEESLDEFFIPPTDDQHLPNWSKRIPLPLGLSSADRIVAVSPTYAREILTKKYGSGLNDYLKINKKKLSGIINGLDPVAWNPENDFDIPVSFNVEKIKKRKKNKTALLSEFNLINDSIPLLIIISRLDYQKGVDIAIKSIKKLTHLPWNLIVLGSGNKELENNVLDLEKKYPDRVRAVIKFDPLLAKRMYAGGDMLLIPSRYEPCGLTQMIAMLYGCIPVATATGGLKDTINDYPSKNSTGFLSTTNTRKAFTEALQRALNVYENQEEWCKIQKRGMEKDFSWKKSAIAYTKIYLQLIGEE